MKSSLLTPIQRAFTLIELLIVVAIIAILAAIAVPNFLEAQTRSKVSRVKADQRTLATGIEAYRIDENSYPYTAGTTYFTMEERWRQISTPISYVTSIPEDVFGDDEGGRWDETPLKYKLFDFLTFDINVDEPLNGPFGEAGENRSFLINLLANGYSQETKWYVASQGPDQEPGLAVVSSTGTPSFGGLNGIARDVGLPYDPTNGTVSDGDIIRLGPGGGVLE